MPIPPYDERGSGPVVLLSHGTMMDRTMFADQLAGLGDAYRVVAFDHRARTELSVGPYTLDDLGDDCVELLDSLDAERCVLGGMSMGGFMRSGSRFATRTGWTASSSSTPGVGSASANMRGFRQARRRRRPPRGGSRVARGIVFGERRRSASARSSSRTGRSVGGA